MENTAGSFEVMISYIFNEINLMRPLRYILTLKCSELRRQDMMIYLLCRSTRSIAAARYLSPISRSSYSHEAIEQAALCSVQYVEANHS